MNVQALRSYFEVAAPADFRLGGLDCVRFAAEALQAGWGRDYRDRLAYWDRRSAIMRLRASDGLRDAVGEVLGAEIPVEDLLPGDVAYFAGPPKTLGLVMPDYVAVKMGRTIHRVAPGAATFGWRT